MGFRKLERSFDVLNGAGLDLVSHNYDAIAGLPIPATTAGKYREAAPFATLYRKGYLATSTLITRRDQWSRRRIDTTLANAPDSISGSRPPRPDYLVEVFDDALTRYHVTEGSITAQTVSVLPRIALRLHRPGLQQIHQSLDTTAVHL